MRFMFLVTTTNGAQQPPQALIDFMDQARAGSVHSGEMLATGGLGPAAQSHRASVKRGKLAVTDGPFAEARELVGGYAIMELPSMEEAKARARWLMESHITYWPEWEGEVDVRPVYDGPPSELVH